MWEGRYHVYVILPCSLESLNCYGDGVARAAEIGKADRNGQSGRNAARQSEVHLVVAWIPWSVAEI
jgi:hypothetical protein